MQKTEVADIATRLRFAQLRALWYDKVALIAAIVFGTIIFAAIAAPYISPYHPYQLDLDNTLVPPFFMGGSLKHILGTDQSGRDVLSGLICGARVSLFVACLSVIIGGSVGLLVGILAGYRPGRLGDIIMRLADTQLGFPPLIMVIVVMVMIGRGILNLTIVLAILEWPIVARMARGLAIAMREEQFVDAARATGCKDLRIMLRHILPNLLWPLVTLGILDMARYVLAEATLSFLGLGIAPPAVSWGLLMAESRDYLFIAWSFLV